MCSCTFLESAWRDEHNDMPHEPLAENVVLAKNGDQIDEFFFAKTLFMCDLAHFCTRCSPMNCLSGNVIRTRKFGREVYQFSDRMAFTFSGSKRGKMWR